MPAFAATAGMTRGARLDGTPIIFYVRGEKGAEVAPVAGAPALPDRYKEYYENGAIEGTVIKINPDRTVVLDRGSDGRMHAGLRLACWDGKDAEVLSVTDTTALARLWYYADSTAGPHVGDVFSTGSGWVAPRPELEKRYRYLVDVPHRPLPPP